MTTPTAPTSPNEPTGHPRSAFAGVQWGPRRLAAWGLVGFVALYLFFQFVQWMLPGYDGTFIGRSLHAGFRNLDVLVMPVLAVLLAAYVTPALTEAKIIATIALVEYGIALFFGLVTLLAGFGGLLDQIRNARSFYDALEYLVMGGASLALITIAGYTALRVIRS